MRIDRVRRRSSHSLTVRYLGRRQIGGVDSSLMIPFRVGYGQPDDGLGMGWG
jgi:hypothetical protein